MQAMIWAGAALTVAGLAGLVYCIMRATKAKRLGLDDAAMRAEMQRVVMINLAAVGVSGLGLAVVVMGIVLG